MRTMFDEIMAMPRSRSTWAKRNPFYVTPKGSAQHVEPDEYASLRAQGKIPRRIEREALIESHTDLPPGYSLVSRGREYQIFFQGKPTGKFALDERKAREIASRMSAGKVAQFRTKGANVAPSKFATKAERGDYAGKFFIFEGVQSDRSTWRAVAGPFDSVEQARMAAKSNPFGRKNCW